MNITADELLDKLNNEELTLDEIDQMYQNGEISEEVYNEFNSALDDITNQENTEDPNVQESGEPSVDDLLSAIDGGHLTVDDVKAMYENGELSEETYNDFTKAVDAVHAQPEQEQPQEENSNVDSILAALDSGEIRVEDLDGMLQNGEITEDEYNQIMDIMNGEGAEDQQPEEPQPEPQPITSPYSSVHLYDKFVELQKYIKIYIDAFKDIDLDQISDVQHKIVSNILFDIRELEKNIKFYFDNQYELNDYKKNLYSYLLFNKAFSENITKFRRTLQLHKEVLVDEDKDKPKR